MTAKNQKTSGQGNKKVNRRKKSPNLSKKKTNDIDLIEKEKEKFVRLFAEYENYKKRTSKERLELFRTASKDLMISILPVLDDFERAIKQINNDKGDDHIEGFKLIYNKLHEVLKNKGLTEIEISIGDVFDSECHEAISQIPSEKKNKGKIIEVIEKGYQLGEKIIRFPKVIVGQ